MAGSRALVDVVADVEHQGGLAALIRRGQGFGIEATNADQLAREPAEAYLAWLIRARVIDDDHATIIAGNIRGFWAAYLEAVRANGRG